MVKIICTIGPSSSSLDMIRELVNAGMNVARLNFSHGTYEEHKAVIDQINIIRRQLHANIGILQDLSGPKIRVGNMQGDGLSLEDGSELRLTPQGDFIDSRIPVIPVSYPLLLEDIKEGGRILLDDGMLELKNEKKEDNALLCRVVHGGILKSHKGVNFPDDSLSEGAPTEKDIKDLKFGIENNVDFVALSFVQRASDIMTLKSEIAGLHGNVSVISKLERGLALKNLDSILAASDGVMVARGDLGIETELSMIPIYQKQIIRKSNIRGIPVITATQMLDSMIRNPIPTRAEVTDVANAIYDGSDAIMLSGETAAGSYPLETTKMMRKIANHVEENLGVDRNWVRNEEEYLASSNETAVASAVCRAAERIGAKMIIAHSISGQTARLISMYRPATPIIAITPLKSTYNQLSLVWGVQTLLIEGMEEDFLKTVKKTEEELLYRGMVKKGDTVVISAGFPAGKAGGTNLMKVHRIGS
ncbi:MAG: pyruvate kinase [Spirochaetes bacterium]|nr:pyruvate kinase [Spirochaetota bacterium]